MILDLNIGQFDFNRLRVRLNGKVLDKSSLISFMKDLDPCHFYWSLVYADITYSYIELREILFDYLTEC